MIVELSGFPANVVAFACKGQVTRDEYRDVLEPAVAKALAAHDKVRLYYRTDSDFEGVGPGAVWEDFEVGMRHLTRWERIAVVTDVAWIAHTIRAFGFLLPGKLKIFPLAEADAAEAWIAADD